MTTSENRPEVNTEEPEASSQEENGANSGSADSKSELDLLKEQMLRQLAEAQNINRRLQKEVDDTRKYAVSNFAKEMLVIADNFRRALEAVPEQAAQNDAFKNLMVGIEATERQLLSAMDRFGVKAMNPLGQIFDPHYHRVMLEVENLEHPPGTVLQILQPGYMIHDRLLREAMVSVAKGGVESTPHKVDTSA